MAHHAKVRAALLGALTLAALAGALAWSVGPRPSSYATPEECLEAYRTACLAGDAPRYRACLGEPLRSETEHSYADDHALADALRRQTDGVKNWVEVGVPEVRGGRAVATVDEVRATGQRRLRVHLERAGGGWLVVGVERGEERAPDVRYGTRLGAEGAPD
jgi:hypothetical protein